MFARSLSYRRDNGVFYKNNEEELKRNIKEVNSLRPRIWAEVLKSKYPLLKGIFGDGNLIALIKRKVNAVGRIYGILRNTLEEAHYFRDSLDNYAEKIVNDIEENQEELKKPDEDLDSRVSLQLDYKYNARTNEKRLREMRELTDDEYKRKRLMIRLPRQIMKHENISVLRYYYDTIIKTLEGAIVLFYDEWEYMKNTAEAYAALIRAGKSARLVCQTLDELNETDKQLTLGIRNAMREFSGLEARLETMELR